MSLFIYIFDVFLQLEVDIYFSIKEQYVTLIRAYPAELAFQVTPITEQYQFDINRKILLTILSMS